MDLWWNIHILIYYLYRGNIIYLIINVHKSKKKTGVAVDAYGKVIQKKNKKDDDGNINNLLLKNGSSEKKGILKKKDDRNYKQISSYKPTGNLIYNTNLIKSISNVTDGNKKI